MPRLLSRRRLRSTDGDRDPRDVAEALAASGKHAEALAVLSAANRERRDSEIEARLVSLRFQAFASAKRRRLPSWPTSVPDLYPDAVGPPEIGRSELDADTLRSAILNHGGLLVRGFLDPAQVDRVVGCIDRAFAAYDTWERGERDEDGGAWFTPMDDYSPLDRSVARERGGVLAVESPRALFETMETLDEAGLRELVNGYFAEDPAILANKWTLRRVAADGNPDWHQDGAFMGADIRSLDVWVPLSPCGQDAPGLDVVARRLDSIVTTGTDGAQLDWTVGPGMVDRVAQGTVARPVFDAGDAMLFDHFYLHRTGMHPGMTRDRYALEAWFASPSSYPAAQLPAAY